MTGYVYWIGRIEPIEQATGRPVVTNVQAQIAASLQRLDYGRPIHGYGRLLARTAGVGA